MLIQEAWSDVSVVTLCQAALVLKQKHRHHPPSQINDTRGRPGEAISKQDVTLSIRVLRLPSSHSSKLFILWITVCINIFFKLQKRKVEKLHQVNRNQIDTAVIVISG